MGSGNCVRAALPIANKKTVDSAKRRNHDNNIRPSGSDGGYASPFKGTPVWGQEKSARQERRIISFVLAIECKGGNQCSTLVARRFTNSFFYIGRAHG